MAPWTWEDLERHKCETALAYQGVPHNIHCSRPQEQRCQTEGCKRGEGTGKRGLQAGG